MDDDDVGPARDLGGGVEPRGSRQRLHVVGRSGLAAAQGVADGARGGVGAVVAGHGQPAHVEAGVAQQRDGGAQQVQRARGERRA